MVELASHSTEVCSAYAHPDTTARIAACRYYVDAEMLVSDVVPAYHIGANSVQEQLGATALKGPWPRKLTYIFNPCF